MAKQKKEMAGSAARVRAVLGVALGAGSFLMLLGIPLFFVGLGCAVGALVSAVPLTRQQRTTYQIPGVIAIILVVAVAGIAAFR